MPAPPPPPPSKKGGLAPPPPPPARGGSKPGNAPSPAPPASPKGPPRPQDPSSPHANTSSNGNNVNGPSAGLSPGGPGDERRGSGTVNGRPASPGRLAHPPPAKHRPGSGGGSGSGKRPSSRERRGSASGRASPPASPRQRPSSPQRLRPDSPGARSTDDDNHNSHGDHGRRTASPPPPSGPRPGSPSGTGVRPGSPSSLGMAGRPVTPPTRANASAGLGNGGVRILVSVPARDVGAESRPARVVPVDARPMDTVEEVKTRVQGEIGVAPVARSKQRLLLERKHLLEGLTLEACDLAGRGADVRLDLEDDIPVKVQLPPDREITLDVFLSDYCGTVKTMVQDKEGVSLALRESQGLLFNGKKLKDYLTLEEAGVVPGCELIFDDAEKVPPSPTPYLVAGVVLLSLGLLLFIICLILCCTSARMG